MNNDINHESLSDVKRIDHTIVRKALNKLKTGKSDALYDYNSDCLINAPDDHLVNLFRSFANHGCLPHYLLVCTLIPLIKDQLGDLASSENYRAICISSLIMKVWDWVVLLLDGDKLQCDELQFGFQPETSTSMCTWSVTAVIDYFNRAGTTVYGCAMDLSKAFDMVEWCALFRDLKEKGVSVIFIRLLMNIYKEQFCDVKWNSAYSHRFSISNGCRQGTISSPLFFNVYMNKLILKLRGKKIGCSIGGVYYGIMVYCDDIFLLSCSRTGLQAMVTDCEKYAEARHMKFSTNADPTKSKTKCVIFTKNASERKNVLPIILNGNKLAYVDEVKHLGHHLYFDNNMSKDCDIKRGKFIGKVHSIAAPEVLMRLYNIYASSFYGSNLYQLFSKNCTRLYSAWNLSLIHI